MLVIIKRTTALIVVVIASLAVTACKDSKPAGGEDCSWGITCPSSTSCHEPSLQCVTAEQLEVCSGEADSTPCSYSGSGDYDICEGGACVGPTILVAEGVGAISANETHLFWTTHDTTAGTSSIHRMAFPGGTTVTIVEGLEDGIEHFTAGPSQIYFVSDLYTIKKISVEDGTVSTFHTEDEYNRITAMTASTTDVIWAVHDFSSIHRTIVRSAPQAGGPAILLYSSDLIASGFDQIGTGDHFLVATSLTQGTWVVDLNDANNSFHYSPAAGQFYDFAVASDVAYCLRALTVSSELSHDVVMLPLSTSDASSVLAPLHDAPGKNIAVNPTNAEVVYWSAWKSEQDSDGTIARLPTQGGSPEILVGGQKTPGQLVVGPAHVYWLAAATTVDASGHALLRMPK